MTRDERTTALAVWSTVLRYIRSGTPAAGIESIALGNTQALAGPILEEHRANGFDDVVYDTEDNKFLMRCSQCTVVIIQHTACHELGCPNRVKRKRDDD